VSFIFLVIFESEILVESWCSDNKTTFHHQLINCRYSSLWQGARLEEILEKMWSSVRPDSRSLKAESKGNSNSQIQDICVGRAGALPRDGKLPAHAFISNKATFLDMSFTDSQRSVCDNLPNLWTSSKSILPFAKCLCSFLAAERGHTSWPHTAFTSVLARSADGFLSGKDWTRARCSSRHADSQIGYSNRVSPKMASTSDEVCPCHGQWEPADVCLVHKPNSPNSQNSGNNRPSRELRIGLHVSRGEWSQPPVLSVLTCAIKSHPNSFRETRRYVLPETIFCDSLNDQSPFHFLLFLRVKRLTTHIPGVWYLILMALGHDFLSTVTVGNKFPVVSHRVWAADNWSRQTIPGRPILFAFNRVVLGSEMERSLTSPVADASFAEKEKFPDSVLGYHWSWFQLNRPYLLEWRWWSLV
jgi:hypothetical protein